MIPKQFLLDFSLEKKKKKSYCTGLYQISNKNLIFFFLKKIKLKGNEGGGGAGCHPSPTWGGR
jgi:hypothetical protein